jgi:hypothetical protein
MKFSPLFILYFFSFSLQGQSTRLVLFEEFTQASCGPCAEMNPALNDLLNDHYDKVVSIKYQTYFPGIDPMNQHNPVEVDDRGDYYNISGVPFSKLDGGIAFSGIPDQMDSLDIINRHSVLSPFEVDVNFFLSPNNDSIHCYAAIRATQAISGSLVAHMVIIERDIYFATSPGTNDETHFEGVMKKMLPGSAGTIVQPSWIPGDSLTLNYSWKLSNVYDINQLACIVFIQDTVTKEVLQAGYRPPNISEDIAITSVTDMPLLQCSNTLSPLIHIRNNGFNTVTNVDIVYYLNDVQTQVYSWIGNLLSYHDTSFNFPPIILGDGGHILKFRAQLPNGVSDIISLNDTVNIPVAIATNSNLLPFFETFSGNMLPSVIYVLDPKVDGHSWQYSSIGNGTGSIEMPVFGSDEFGALDYFFLPKFDLTNTTSAIQLSFDVAYAPYSAALADELSIGVSTDCGMNWTTIFNKDGTDLATAAATTSAFTPSANQWRNETISLDSFAGMNEVMIRYELYGRRGNNIYIDNIQVIDNQVGLPEINQDFFPVYPMPASEKIRFSNKNFRQAEIFDLTGQKFFLMFLNQGENSIDVSGIEAGIYFIRFVGGNESVTIRFLIQH